MKNSIHGMSEYRRAWVEIDLDALTHNVEELCSLLPVGCELMAIVKTDAYGHGAESISAHLQRAGVKSYGVATVEEGVNLRESGLQGEILVLGYTHPDDAELMSAYALSQLVFDGAYAKSLDHTGSKINVHIAIDTGMHRLGILYTDIAEI